MTNQPKEREVICPMRHRMKPFVIHRSNGRYTAQYTCQVCNWTAPMVLADTAEEALEQAYRAAMKPYGAAPLTLDEIRESKFPFPVWVEIRGVEALGLNILTGVNPCGVFGIWSLEKPNIRTEDYGVTARYWLLEPSEEARREAEWKEREE